VRLEWLLGEDGIGRPALPARLSFVTAVGGGEARCRFLPLPPEPSFVESGDEGPGEVIANAAKANGAGFIE